MALDTDAILIAFIQNLKDNTATLAGGLASASAITKIEEGNPATNMPTSIRDFPLIWVTLSRETEEIDHIGNGSPNKHELEFLVYPLIYYSAGISASNKDIRVLSKNIETVLKANETLSATAEYLLPESIDFFPAELDENVYLSGAQILVRTHHYST